MTLAKSALAFGLALTTLTGCVAGFDGGPLTRPGEPTGVVVVRNASPATLTAVTISDCNNFTHGLNRLPSGTTLAPGQTYSWTVSAGCWDVQAGYGWGTGYSVADFRETVSPGETQVFTVLN